MLYSFLVSSFLLVVVALAYTQRAHILPLLPSGFVSKLPSFLQAPSSSGARGGYSRLSAFDWASQARAGLSSAMFDIEANVRDGDSRAGLDEYQAAEVHAIMATRGVNFDEARLIVHEQHLIANGIDPRTGLSTDAKSVTFGSR